ncbi:hypothetical protein [Reyranella sp.]|jgi:CheY-like chemotaxis protein|uniref:hypothetical protein n=1 Tax=Reyranella sp. TaxID=1929291 RepID=UPI002F9529ED
MQPLESMKVLVVEDEFLIAMDLELMLRKMGAADVRIELDIAGALTALRAKDLPDCAVLDIGFGAQSTEPVADLLLHARVPFIFATGYGDTMRLPARFRAVPIVRKPLGAADLEDAFIRVFAAARR